MNTENEKKRHMSFNEKTKYKKNILKKTLEKISFLYENENKYRKRDMCPVFKSETYVIVEITKPISKKGGKII